jgi:hypothetical protein
VPWKRTSSCGGSNKPLCLAILAAFIAGILACLIGSVMQGSYNSFSDKYSAYSAVRARLGGQDPAAVIEKYRSMAK